MHGNIWEDLVCACLIQGSDYVSFPCSFINLNQILRLFKSSPTKQGNILLVFKDMFFMCIVCFDCENVGLYLHNGLCK